MVKRIVSVMLTACILLSCIAIGTFATTQASAASVDYGLVDNVQDGQILQCWNWSFNSIKNNMALIVEQGFSAIQTSPIQATKETTTGTYGVVSKGWWLFYQPIGLYIEDNEWNALGTKEDFVAMCEVAHRYGVKVIVDAVMNHLANGYANTIHSLVPSEIKNDSNCWHYPMQTITNYSNRYDITQYTLDGLPDLNTGSSTVQGYAVNFLKECIDAGADGFRFDAARHIETPSDYYTYASDYWPNVLNAATSYAQSTRGITPYYYGEVLDDLNGLPATAYTDYMSITDNKSSNDIRNNVAGGNAQYAANSYINFGSAANKTVQWNESHDTYADGSSSGISDSNVNKTWAIVGSRAEICSMYLARPTSTSDRLGTAGITAWANTEVKAVNQFKNAMVGQGEYMTYSGSIAYVERGTKGVVLVNVGGNATSVSVPAHTIADGTYKDAITGNTFTVSGGYIYGSIGDTGIAVVYNQPPKASITPGTSSYRSDTLTLTLNYANATSGQYSIDGGAYQSYTDGQQITIGSGVAYGGTTTVAVKSSNGSEESSVSTYTYTKMDPSETIDLYFDNSNTNWSTVYAYFYNDATDEAYTAWPGVQMTIDGDTDYYKTEIPLGCESGRVIFTNNSGSQVPASGQAGYPLSAETLLYQGGGVGPFTPTTLYSFTGGKLYCVPGVWAQGIDLQAHIWGSESLWISFYDSDGDGVYEADIPSGDWKRIQWHRVSNSSIYNSTVVSTFTEGLNCYTLPTGVWNDVLGTWSCYGSSTTSTTASTTVANPTYYLAGSFNGWSETGNALTVSGTTASTTVTLDAGTYEFKIIDCGVWYGYASSISDATATSGVTMKNSAGNATLVATGGTYTFSYNTSTKKLVVSYTAPETEATTVAPTTAEPTTEATTATTEATTAEPTTEATTATTEATQATTEATEATTVATETTTEAVTSNYFLAGSFNSWSQISTPMVVSGTTATATVTLNAGTYEFKVIDNGNWYGYDGTISNSTTGVSMGAWSGNAKLVATGGTYTFSYNTSSRKIAITYTAAETEPTEAISTNYFLAGSFNDWSQVSTPMAVSGTTATATVTLAAGNYKFKVIDNGNWYGNNGTIINTTTLTSSIGWEMSASAGDCGLQASGGTYTFSYNTSTRMLVITYSSSSSSDSGWNAGEDTTDDQSATNAVLEVPECEHTYDEGEVTKDATYTAKGEKTYTCTICGDTKTESIAKLKIKTPSVKIKAGKKKITVNYKKVAGVTGYQIKYKVNGKVVTKTFKAKNTLTKVIKNLKKGSYKVQIRAIVNNNGVKAYSNWTKVTTVKVK